MLNRPAVPVSRRRVSTQEGRRSPGGGVPSRRRDGRTDGRREAGGDLYPPSSGPRTSQTFADFRVMAAISLIRVTDFRGFMECAAAVEEFSQQSLLQYSNSENPGERTLCLSQFSGFQCLRGGFPYRADMRPERKTLPERRTSAASHTHKHNLHVCVPCPGLLGDTHL